MVERIAERCNGCWNYVLARCKNITLLKKSHVGRKIAYFTAPGECVVCYACHQNCSVEGAINVNPDKMPKALQKRVPAFVRLAIDA